jgi:hypothetical protein
MNIASNSRFVLGTAIVRTIAPLAAAVLLGCSIPVITPTNKPVASFPKIDRTPEPLVLGGLVLASLPHYDSLSGDIWQMDMRGNDLSNLDLRNSLRDLLYCAFDDKTKWPAAQMLPASFDPSVIEDLGKNPGLGVRQLHAAGMTGKGIGIGIIDQVLLVNHVEYSDRLQLYEEFQNESSSAAMHSSAVASIAAGKSVGVAPEADLYFIATSFGDYSNPVQGQVAFSNAAIALWRLLNVNDQLPPEKKIRVISMSIGWNESDEGYQEIHAVCQAAKARGILVVSSSIEQEFGLKFHALGRNPLADPDSFDSYVPGMFWANDFYANPENSFYANRLLVPMDSRCTASPTGNNDYVFYREGGVSWSIPYIAGMYALCAQVKPSITPDLFWSKALSTGRYINLLHNGQTIRFGPILDPAALIGAL